jgi:hypothetical protein
MRRDSFDFKIENCFRESERIPLFISGRRPTSGRFYIPIDSVSLSNFNASINTV